MRETSSRNGTLQDIRFSWIGARSHIWRSCRRKLWKQFFQTLQIYLKHTVIYIFTLHSNVGSFFNIKACFKTGSDDLLMKIREMMRRSGVSLDAPHYLIFAIDSESGWPGSTAQRDHRHNVSRLQNISERVDVAKEEYTPFWTCLTNFLYLSRHRKTINRNKKAFSSSTVRLLFVLYIGSYLIAWRYLYQDYELDIKRSYVLSPMNIVLCSIFLSREIRLRSDSQEYDRQSLGKIA